MDEVRNLIKEFRNKLAEMSIEDKDELFLSCHFGKSAGDDFCQYNIGELSLNSFKMNLRKRAQEGSALFNEDGSLMVAATGVFGFNDHNSNCFSPTIGIVTVFNMKKLKDISLPLEDVEIPLF